MLKTYTIKELEQIWDCSYPVADKKVKQKNFNSTELIIGGRKVRAFEVPENKLYEIKQEIQDNKKAMLGKEVDNKYLSNDNEIINQSSEVVNEYSKPSEDISFVVDLMREFKDSLININQSNNEQLLSINQANNERMLNINQTYNQNLLERDKKLLLLEDSESRTKREYLELKAENKQLKEKLENFNKLEYEHQQTLEKNKALEIEILKLKEKSFFGIKFK